MDSSTPSNKLRSSTTGLLWGMIALAVIGFADASYLTIDHFMHRIPPCTTGGCEIVLTSKFATIGPVPLALVGALYYLVIFILIQWLANMPDDRPRKLLKLLLTAGFLISLGLVGLQAFVIHAWCYYCLTSAGTTTVLFLLSLFLPWRLPGSSM